MSTAHLYEDFSAFSAFGAMATNVSNDELENAQLTGFETGYQAGWDDAVKAKSEESEKLSVDLVQSVQDMSFTYQDAYSKLTSGMQPLMARFVTTVLPNVAQEALKSQILDQIDRLMETQLENVIELVVPLGKSAIFVEFIENKVRVPFAILEEPSLSEGQVYLRVNKQEREINIDAILTEVSEAVDAFVHATQPKVKNG